MLFFAKFFAEFLLSQRWHLKLSCFFNKVIKVDFFICLSYFLNQIMSAAGRHYSGYALGDDLGLCSIIWKNINCQKNKWVKKKYNNEYVNMYRCKNERKITIDENKRKEMHLELFLRLGCFRPPYSNSWWQQAYRASLFNMNEIRISSHSGMRGARVVPCTMFLLQA